MDFTEDLSCRVLLKRILITEPPRTPVIRSVSEAPSSSGSRRSSRLIKKNAELQTPQGMLRRSMRHKISESVIRKSLSATTKRRTTSVLLETKPPSTSMLFNEEDTPRHLLRNILQTEPVKSPVIHEKEHPKKPEQQSAGETATKTRSSIELSGLDLPDVTIGNVASIAKGLSRKRPRRSLNVTAFEKQLKDGDDTGGETEHSENELSSLSLSSFGSLSLKTPFADVRTEKRGLQRKVPNRRKITEEEFGAALSKQHMGDVSSSGLVKRNLGEVTNSEEFTLGLSKINESNLTTDIVNCNTALYDQPDAMTSNFSIIGTQDKPTLMPSQLPTDQEENGSRRDKSLDLFPSEKAATGPRNEECVSDPEAQEDIADTEPQTEEGQNQLDDGSEVASEPEEEEDAVESETNTDDRTESKEVEAQIREEGADSEENEGLDELIEKEEISSDSQREEDKMVEKEECAVGSQSEDDEEGSQSEEEAALGSQPEEEGAADSRTEEVAASFPSQDEADAGTDEEEVSPDSQPKEEGAADSQTEEVASSFPSQDEAEVASQSKEEAEDVAESQTEEEHKEEEEEQLEGDLELISRRSRRSEAALILPIVEAGYDLDDGLAAENDPESEKENSSHLHGLSQNAEVSGPESVASSEDARAQDSAEQEEEWDDEEAEEIPSKTPAFVKEKRNFFHSDPSASPVFKKIQASFTGEALPAVKPKQVRRRKTRTTRNEAVLPKTYLMSVFKHFAKTKVSADVYPVLNEIMDKFLDRLTEDLETYARHAKRKTIEVEDAKLLLQRQGYVNDKVPVEVLIEKYLRMEQRKLLIPIATSGNVVIPKTRR
ncbi:centromere protein T isoform X1 [Kryptolebias marmoratus]|uniref:Centromere protein T n=1 Tax=Kryptolebias marmoratus TaxID=37003 RepID=A0A3Q3BQ55_KRYMA|nr:centromere protein T isoform X1 [Kryptolebias marmoratus]